MNYTEAVSLAKAGDESGYSYLYESTYKSKYYLALQYMKNEEAAQDVIQDAYIKAFSKLDTLENPETFPGWLGTIVANTAKNALVKKNPMLFSDVAVDDEGENFEYQIEDDSPDNQPEVAYTRQETQELVHELIDSLSEEQKMCILMFHIEGASIHEIAETLDCSENTVKSRLNYGRKNLKAKAEELQKKGYKLYGIAPLPLFLYLFRAEAAQVKADPSLAAAGKRMAEKISAGIRENIGTGPGIGAGQTDGENAEKTDGESVGKAAGKASEKAAGKTAAKGILHTAAGKTAAIVVGVCVIGGGAFYGASQMNQGSPEPEQTVTQEESQMQEPEVAEEPEEQEEPAFTEVSDEDYPNLVAGNLTKEELAFVLAAGPEQIPPEGFTEQDYMNYINAMVQMSDEYGGPIRNMGRTENWQIQYSIDDINRMLLAFTTYQYTEENDSDTEYGMNVEGDVLIFSPATLNYSADAEITSAEYSADEMDVYFVYEHTWGPETLKPNAGETVVTSKKAVLKPDDTGMYRIVSIEEVQETAENAVPVQETGGSVQGESSVREVYAGVLQSVQNSEPGYEFPNAGNQVQSWAYTLCDMDGDGLEELIVGAKVAAGPFMYYDCRAFGCDSSGDGSSVKMISGEEMVQSLYYAADGNGVYDLEIVSRGTGAVEVYRLTVQDNALAVSGAEYSFTLGDSSMEQFRSGHTEVTWYEITDLTGVDLID